MATIKLVPEPFQRASRLRAELVNAPRIGDDDNVYFTQVQANISKCYPRNNCQKMEQLGAFADRHVDGDHAGKYTCAGACSDMPASYHPGLFILYELGVFVRLDNGHHVCFSGLRYHGGTPPTAPGDETPQFWACRLLHISYPSLHLTDMRGKQSIGPSGISNHEILYLTPEMMNHCIPNLKDFPLHAQRASYVSDGVGIMSQEAQTTLVSRLLLQVNGHEYTVIKYLTGHQSCVNIRWQGCHTMFTLTLPNS